jgi:hypothetical protein
MAGDSTQLFSDIESGDKFKTGASISEIQVKIIKEGKKQEYSPSVAEIQSAYHRLYLLHYTSSRNGSTLGWDFPLSFFNHQPLNIW